MSDTSGPAFPAPNFIVPSDLEARHVFRLGETRGMTLRDYFAAQALIGIVIGMRAADRRKYRDSCATGIEVATAYAMADAMLAERAK